VADREPSLLKDDSDGHPDAAPKDADTEPTAAPRTSAPEVTTAPMGVAGRSIEAAPRPTEPVARAAIGRDVANLPPSASDGRRAPVVHVVGFWKRAVAAFIDLAVVLPTAMLVTFLASKISGVRLPSEKLRLLDIDLWIDLVLATDPAIVMGLVLFFAVSLTYLFVFHLLQGRTLGMRLMRMRVIDIYGDRPSPARCAARCAGYLAGVATLFLGFLWMGFDSEKRGLQDWLAGTYVIRA
jgi:uncharacterized RDD family membrane protein YckC